MTLSKKIAATILFSSLSSTAFAFPLSVSGLEKMGIDDKGIVMWVKACLGGQGSFEGCELVPIREDSQDEEEREKMFEEGVEMGFIKR